MQATPQPGRWRRTPAWPMRGGPPEPEAAGRYGVPPRAGPRARRARVGVVTTTTERLTQYAHGGGCACKIPPGELEAVVAGLVGTHAPDGPGQLLVGLDDGDDAAVVKI